MNTDAFTNPNGKIIKSTFQPKLLPPKISYDDELVGMIVTAEAKIGELKGIADVVIHLCSCFPLLHIGRCIK